MTWLWTAQSAPWGSFHGLGLRVFLKIGSSLIGEQMLRTQGEGETGNEERGKEAEGRSSVFNRAILFMYGFIFGCTCCMWTRTCILHLFWGQELNPCHSRDLSRGSGHIRSLTRCASQGLNLSPGVPKIPLIPLHRGGDCCGFLLEIFLLCPSVCRDAQHSRRRGHRWHHWGHHCCHHCYCCGRHGHPHLSAAAEGAEAAGG